MDAAASVLADHPVNNARRADGKRPANAIWLWGQGKAPAMPNFEAQHRLKGAIISAVDLVRGVGMLAGWTRIDVPGATGYLDTDYAAKGAMPSRPCRITTSSACTSRRPTRPATRAVPTPRSRPSSVSMSTSSRRARGTPGLSSVAHLDLAGSLDPASHQGARPGPGGLDDGRNRASRLGTLLR